MNSRIHRLAITNFKAFREFSLSLEGRNLLVYGANGSGKSSLYWVLYTFRPPDLTPWCHGTARVAKAAWTLDFVLEIHVAPVIGSYSG